ncbi:MAG TPA: hypothetical protein VGX23_31190 [Actinocrinis sp.]|nr:hypothetical protein [Actinocrinis sp.]
MFATNPQVNEEKALGEVKERLRARYAGRSPAEVSLVVDKTAAEFRSARIRDFVPVLVEHLSREELGRRPVAAR